MTCVEYFVDNKMNEDDDSRRMLSHGVAKYDNSEEIILDSSTIACKKKSLCSVLLKSSNDVSC